MQQMSNDPKNQYSGQSSNPPHPYGQYGQPNTGMDYNQQMTSQMPMGGSSNNLPSNSYPNATQSQFERAPSGHMYGMAPTPSYHGYDNQQPSHMQQPGSSYSSMPGYRHEGSHPGMGSHAGTGMIQQQDRGNYGSYQEGSAPIGQIGMNQNPYMQKQAEYISPHERSQGTTSQAIRNEASMPHNYGQSNIGGIQRTPSHMGGVAGLSQSNDQNMIGGFLRQTSNQPNQMIGQHYNQSSTMEASGINDGHPQYGLSGGDMNNMPSLTSYMGGGGNDPNQPNFQYSGMPSNQPTGAIGGIPKSNDLSNMDIGALNRMAEYYATNSDYPKAIEYFEKMTSI